MKNLFGNWFCHIVSGILLQIFDVFSRLLRHLHQLHHHHAVRTTCLSEQSFLLAGYAPASQSTLQTNTRETLWQTDKDWKFSRFHVHVFSLSFTARLWEWECEYGRSVRCLKIRMLYYFILCALYSQRYTSVSVGWFSP